jgi:hypothetical protein
MSLHKFAEQVASQGRGDDSLLVHMTPDEVRRLQAFAEANGTTMTINPDTGLPEAGMLSDLFKAVAPIALGAFLGPAGMGLTFGGLSSAVSAGIATGGITALATGSLSRGLMAGLGAYGGAGLAEGISNMGATALSSEALAAANASADPIASLAAAKDAATAAGTMAPTGMQAFTEGAKRVFTEPGGFSQLGNAMGGTGKLMSAGLMAASPIMADMMVPTTTKQPNTQSNDTINQSIYDPYSGTYRRLNPVPAANYGTPAYKPFAGGGIVALNSGGVAHYETGGGVKDYTNLYNTFGGKEAYEKVAADYLKATNNNTAGLAEVMAQYDKPAAAAVAAAPAALTPEQKAAMNLMFRSSTGGANTSEFDAMGGSDAVKKLAQAAGYDGTDTQLYNYAAANPGSIDWLSDAGKQLAMNNYTSSYSNKLATTFKTPAEQALELFYRSTTGGAPTAAFDALGGYAAAKKLAESAGFEASPEWQQAYEKKMGYTVIPRASTAETQAADRLLQAQYDAKDRAAKIAADAATGANKVTSGGVVDLLTDTGVTQTTKDNTTVGKNTLATTTAGGITAPKVTTDGTYTGTAGTAPTMGTLFGQGKFVGTGTEMGTGTTGPILDFGGTTAFGTTSPLAAAKAQIAEQSAAKNLADKNKLDLYSQWGAANPKATNLEHANFVDKIGLDPAVAAQLIGISPDQAQNAYNDAKYNKMTGDSEAAYRYLMGQGAYPTKSKVGEIMRPYSEATLGMPASTNRKYIYDQATGKYNINPDYVAEYKDPAGGTNYLMSQKEIYDYFVKNSKQDDAITYAWAIANNLTPKEISEATGVPISQIAPKWRAAASKSAADKAATEVKKEDGTIDKEATDQKIADKAIADKAAADTAADKAVKDNWDEAAYLAANPDVAAELASGKSVSGKPVKFSSGYEHYTMFGKDGGRKATTKAAGGGIMKLAMGGMPMDGYAVGGGLGSLGSYSDGGRLLRGPGDGVSDSIPATIGRKQQPARLADGEFVIPARIVSELGNGSTEAGAKKLYAMMDRVQRARGKTTGKNKVAANSRADKYLPA